MRGRDARSLLALGADAWTTARRVPVDRAGERLPNSLEFGLNESNSGGLSGKDALVEVLLILPEEWFKVRLVNPGRTLSEEVLISAGIY